MPTDYWILITDPFFMPEPFAFASSAFPPDQVFILFPDFKIVFFIFALLLPLSDRSLIGCCTNSVPISIELVQDQYSRSTDSGNG